MAALAQAYPTGDCGCGRRAAAEEIVMMLPDLRCFIPGRKLLMVRKVAVRFPSMEARQSSSLIASSGPGLLKLPPPFATRMSTGPSFLSVSVRIASISAKLVSSAATTMAVPPAPSISARTADIASRSRPWITTLAPCCANERAIAAPIPRELPVITATLSLSVRKPSTSDDARTATQGMDPFTTRAVAEKKRRNVCACSKGLHLTVLFDLHGAHRLQRRDRGGRFGGEASSRAGDRAAYPQHTGGRLRSVRPHGRASLRHRAPQPVDRRAGVHRQGR